MLKENFQSLQRIRQYYDFNDVDVDRYELDGERRVLMVSGREVTQRGIAGSGRTWQNQHLVYTGFGATAGAMAPIDPDGASVLTLEDIPPQGEQPPSTEDLLRRAGGRAVHRREHRDRRARLRGESGEGGGSATTARGSSSAAGFGRPCSPGGSATSTS